MFGSKKRIGPSWECSLCHNRRNPSTKSKCTICQAPRPRDRFGIALNGKFYLCRIYSSSFEPCMKVHEISMIHSQISPFFAALQTMGSLEEGIINALLHHQEQSSCSEKPNRDGKHRKDQESAAPLSGNKSKIKDDLIGDDSADKQRNYASFSTTKPKPTDPSPGEEIALNVIKSPLGVFDPGLSLFDHVLQNASSVAYDAKIGQYVSVETLDTTGKFFDKNLQNKASQSGDGNFEKSQVALGMVKRNLSYVESMLREKQVMKQVVKEVVQRREVAYLYDNSADLDINRSEYEKKSDCPMCERIYPTSQMPAQISFKAVMDWKVRHGVQFSATDHRLDPARLHDAIKLCSFCSQFFDPDASRLVDKEAVKADVGLNMAGMHGPVNCSNTVYKKMFRKRMDAQESEQERPLSRIRHRLALDQLKFKAKDTNSKQSRYQFNPKAKDFVVDHAKVGTLLRDKYISSSSPAGLLLVEQSKSLKPGKKLQLQPLVKSTEKVGSNVATSSTITVSNSKSKVHTSKTAFGSTAHPNTRKNDIKQSSNSPSKAKKSKKRERQSQEKVNKPSTRPTKDGAAAGATPSSSSSSSPPRLVVAVCEKGQPESSSSGSGAISSSTSIGRRTIEKVTKHQNGGTTTEHEKEEAYGEHVNSEVMVQAPLGVDPTLGQQASSLPAVRHGRVLRKMRKSAAKPLILKVSAESSSSSSAAAAAAVDGDGGTGKSTASVVEIEVTTRKNQHAVKTEPDAQNMNLATEKVHSHQPVLIKLDGSYTGSVAPPLKNLLQNMNLQKVSIQQQEKPVVAGTSPTKEANVPKKKHSKGVKILAPADMENEVASTAHPKVATTPSIPSDTTSSSSSSSSSSKKLSKKTVGFSSPSSVEVNTVVGGRAGADCGAVEGIGKIAGYEEDLYDIPDVDGINEDIDVATGTAMRIVTQSVSGDATAASLYGDITSTSSSKKRKKKKSVTLLDPTTPSVASTIGNDQASSSLRGRISTPISIHHNSGRVNENEKEKQQQEFGDVVVLDGGAEEDFYDVDFELDDDNGESVQHQPDGVMQIPISSPLPTGPSMAFSPSDSQPVVGTVTSDVDMSFLEEAHNLPLEEEVLEAMSPPHHSHHQYQLQQQQMPHPLQSSPPPAVESIEDGYNVHPEHVDIAYADGYEEDAYADEEIDAFEEEEYYRHGGGGGGGGGEEIIQEEIDETWQGGGGSMDDYNWATGGAYIPGAGDGMAIDDAACGENLMSEMYISEETSLTGSLKERMRLLSQGSRHGLHSATSQNSSNSRNMSRGSQFFGSGNFTPNKERMKLISTGSSGISSAGGGGGGEAYIPVEDEGGGLGATVSPSRRRHYGSKATVPVHKMWQEEGNDGAAFRKASAKAHGKGNGMPAVMKTTQQPLQRKVRKKSIANKPSIQSSGTGMK